MKLSLFCTLILSCLLIIGCSNSSHQQEDAADFTLIKHVQLLDLSNQGKNGNDMEDAYVLIKGEQISASGE